MEKSSSSGAQAKREVAPATHRRVLVVDDKRDAGECLAMLLTALGHEVHIGYGGQQVIEMIRDWKPDVALIDIGLPEVNGYEVARTVRQESGLDRVVLVAYSGYGRDEDRQRAKEAGFDQHLVKPADLASLQAILRLSR